VKFCGQKIGDKTAEKCRQKCCCWTGLLDVFLRPKLPILYMLLGGFGMETNGIFYGIIGIISDHVV
jgi:hypothetical protein